LSNSTLLNFFYQIHFNDDRASFHVHDHYARAHCVRDFRRDGHHDGDCRGDRHDGDRRGDHRGDRHDDRHVHHGMGLLVVNLRKQLKVV